MSLDRDFVRTLNPSLASLLPHGSMKIIADNIGKGPLTVRNAIHGASTNEAAIREAIKTLMLLDQQITTLLNQVPVNLRREILEEIHSPVAEKRAG